MPTRDRAPQRGTRARSIAALVAVIALGAMRATVLRAQDAGAAGAAADPCARQLQRLAAAERTAQRARTETDRTRSRAAVRAQRRALADCQVATALRATLGAAPGDDEAEGCARGCVTATPVDESSDGPFAPSTRIAVSVWARSVESAGRVAAVSAREVRIVLDRGDPPQSRDVRLQFPADVRVPMAVGEPVRVLVSYTPAAVRGTGLADVRITDAAGALLFAESQSGAASVAPGWQVLRGGAFGAAAPGSFTLDLRHAGRRALTRPNAWRTLTAPDGRWAVSGHELAGRPRAFTILRVR